MAGNSFFGFPDDFFNDSEDPEVIYGDMHSDFRNLYENMVTQSDTYAEMNDVEKLFLADEFMELFYYGGYSMADQKEWLAFLGLRSQDFDWDEYRAIYDSL